jgi:hypothetical protein
MPNKLLHTWRGDYCECVRPFQLPVLTEVRAPSLLEQYLRYVFHRDRTGYNNQLMIIPPMHNQLLPFGPPQVLTLDTFKPLLYFLTGWRYFSSSQTSLCITAAYPFLGFFMDQWTLEYQCSWFCKNVRNRLPPDATSHPCRHDLSKIYDVFISKTFSHFLFHE